MEGCPRGCGSAFIAGGFQATNCPKQCISADLLVCIFAFLYDTVSSCFYCISCIIHNFTGWIIELKAFGTPCGVLFPHSCPHTWPQIWLMTALRNLCSEDSNETETSIKQDSPLRMIWVKLLHPPHILMSMFGGNLTFLLLSVFQCYTCNHFRGPFDGINVPSTFHT